MAPPFDDEDDNPFVFGDEGPIEAPSVLIGEEDDEEDPLLHDFTSSGYGMDLALMEQAKNISTQDVEKSFSPEIQAWLSTQSEAKKAKFRELQRKILAAPLVQDQIDLAEGRANDNAYEAMGAAGAATGAAMMSGGMSIPASAGVSALGKYGVRGFRKALGYTDRPFIDPVPDAISVAADFAVPGLVKGAGSLAKWLGPSVAPADDAAAATAMQFAKRNKLVPDDITPWHLRGKNAEAVEAVVDRAKEGDFIATQTGAAARQNNQSLAVSSQANRADDGLTALWKRLRPSGFDDLKGKAAKEATEAVAERDVLRKGLEEAWQARTPEAVAKGQGAVRFEDLDLKELDDFITRIKGDPALEDLYKAALGYKRDMQERLGSSLTREFRASDSPPGVSPARASEVLENLNQIRRDMGAFTSNNLAAVEKGNQGVTQAGAQRFEPIMRGVEAQIRERMGKAASELGFDEAALQAANTRYGLSQRLGEVTDMLGQRAQQDLSRLEISPSVELAGTGAAGGSAVGLGTSNPISSKRDLLSRAADKLAGWAFPGLKQATDDGARFVNAVGLGDRQVKNISDLIEIAEAAKNGPVFQPKAGGWVGPDGKIPRFLDALRAGSADTALAQSGPAVPEVLSSLSSPAQAEAPRPYVFPRELKKLPPDALMGQLDQLERMVPPAFSGFFAESKKNLTTALERNDALAVRRVWSGVIHAFPQLAEPGWGVDGRIFDPAEQDSYLKNVEALAKNKDRRLGANPRAFLAAQRSAFNDGKDPLILPFPGE